MTRRPMIVSQKLFHLQCRNENHFFSLIQRQKTKKEETNINKIFATNNCTDIMTVLLSSYFAYTPPRTISMVTPPSYTVIYISFSDRNFDEILNVNKSIRTHNNYCTIIVIIPTRIPPHIYAQTTTHVQINKRNFCVNSN